MNLKNRAKKEYKNGWVQRGTALFHYQKGKLHKDNGPAVIFKEKKMWYHYGTIYRENDLPCVEYENGSKEWYSDKNRFHRLGGPARIIFKNGICFKEWWVNGKKGLLQICNKKEEILKTKYFLNGNVVGGKEQLNQYFIYSNREYCLHSYADIPAITYSNGTKEWYHIGNLHREERPAIEYSNGDEEWWYNGKRHRKDGPAVTYGDKKFWFVNGEFIKCSP